MPSSLGIDVSPDTESAGALPWVRQRLHTLTSPRSPTLALDRHTPAPCQRPGAVALLASLAVLALTGCTRWQFADTPTPAALTDEAVPRVRVTLGNGDRFEILEPLARNDSLVGYTLRPVCSVSEAMDPAQGCPERRVLLGVAGSDLVELELRRRSIARTILLSGGLALGAYQVIRTTARVFGS